MSPEEYGAYVEGSMVWSGVGLVVGIAIGRSWDRVKEYAIAWWARHSHPWRT